MPTAGEVVNGVQDAGDVRAIAIEDFGVGVGRRASV